MAVAVAANRKLEQGTRSRERILDAASRLMAERGYAATSIADIRAKCGLPASSIYWHFGGKEELLAAVMERGANRWFADLPSWRRLRGTAEERLAQSLDAIAERLAAHPQFLRLYILLSIERHEVAPASLAPIHRIRDHAITSLREIFGSALAPGAEGAVADDLAAELARFTICFCDGAFVSHQIDPAATDLRKLFEDLRVGLLAIAKERIAARGGRGKGSARRYEKRGIPGVSRSDAPGFPTAIGGALPRSGEHRTGQMRKPLNRRRHLK